MSGKPKVNDAIVLAIDCGKTMSEKCLNSDPNKSFFELSKQCVENIIRQKIFADSKNEYLLVQLNTKSLRGITINGRLSSPDLELIKYMANELDVVKDGQQINFMDALVAIIDELIVQTRGQVFSSLKVAVFSNFDGLKQSDLMRFQSEVTQKLIQNCIKLTVICDFTPDTKSEFKLSNNQMLALELMKDIERLSVGFCYDLKTALKTFESFEVKKTATTAQYSKLELGKGLNAINIPIVCYITANFYLRKKTHSIKTKASNTANYPALKAKASQTPLSVSAFVSASLSASVSSEVIRGFTYGQTFVPYNKEDKQMFDYNNNEKGYKIIGFTSISNVDVSQRMGSSTKYMFGDCRPKQNNHKLIFQALVKAMIDQQKVGIVRYQLSLRSNPQIGYLLPVFEDNNLMLTYIQLPFAEDFCRHGFTSLESNPKYIPTEKQLEVIDHLIDSMDLMAVDTDGDNQLEVLKSQEILDPTHQHWHLCSYQRHINPNDDLPEMSEQLRKSIDVPKELSEKVDKILEKLCENFNLEENKAKKRNRTQVKPKTIPKLSEGMSSPSLDFKRRKLEELSKI